jgi:hypothetical protein
MECRRLGGNISLPPVLPSKRKNATLNKTKPISGERDCSDFPEVDDPRCSIPGSCHRGCLFLLEWWRGALNIFTSSLTVIDKFYSLCLHHPEVLISKQFALKYPQSMLFP